jgi:hypothetical protein
LGGWLAKQISIVFGAFFELKDKCKMVEGKRSRYDLLGKNQKNESRSDAEERSQGFLG